jgi:hypothetical protein
LRFPLSHFIRLGTGKRGVIIEPGDAEPIVPGIIQPVFVATGPVNVAAIPVGIQDQSWGQAGNIFVVGAGAGSQIQTVTMKAGVWEISGCASFAFNGTVNGVTLAGDVGFSDPGVAANLSVCQAARNPAAYAFAVHFRHKMHFTEDGWSMYLRTFTTVAGDTLVVMLSMNAQRIL